MTSSNSAALHTFITAPTVNIHKLTKNNYTTWKAQVIPYFLGLDGNIPKPRTDIDTINTTSSSSLNLAYSHWICQDALVLSARMSTSLLYVAQIASHQTLYDVWQALEKIFTSQSKAHVIHLSSQLFTLRKGSQSATDFFFNIRKISDELAITSQPLSSDATITYLLVGLGHDYNSLVTIVTARQDLITLEELYSLMLIIANNIASFIGNNSANLSTCQHNSFQPRSRGNFRGRGCGYHRTRLL
jgi:hypothetical protein